MNACVHTYTKPQTSSTRSRGLGRRIHGSVEDTKLSTNKQHTLSLRRRRLWSDPAVWIPGLGRRRLRPAQAVCLPGLWWRRLQPVPAVCLPGLRRRRLWPAPAVWLTQFSPGDIINDILEHQVLNHSRHLRLSDRESCLLVLDSVAWIEVDPSTY